MKGKVSISRRTRNKGEGIISIKITDANSRQIVAEAEMSFSEFAEAVTGMSDCESEIVRVMSPVEASRVGCRCITERVTIDLPDGEYSLSKDTPDEFFDQYIPDGFIMYGNGLRTKQPTGKHVFTVRKWVVDEED